MNAFDRDMEGLAVLHYGDGDYAVLKPGRHVVCAVSGRRIALDALKYWNVARQEPYFGAAEALSRSGVAGSSEPARSGG